MPHNPVTTRLLARFEQPDIPPGCLGLLYQSGRFQRMLEPGEGLTLSERAWGGTTLHLVDQLPHTIQWNARLRSRQPRDYFHVLATLTYRVTDCRKMVEERVRDTELMITRILESALRPVAAEYILVEHEKAAEQLAATITPSLFAGIGLQWDGSDLSILLSDEQLDAIEKENRERHLVSVVHQREYDHELESREAGYSFMANVVLSFRVVDPQRLISRDLDEAAGNLWRQVRSRLQRVSHSYSVDQLEEATSGLLRVLEEGGFEEYGIRLLPSEIRVSLNDVARARATCLIEIRTETAAVEARRGLLEATGALETIRKEQEIALRKRDRSYEGEVLAEGEKGLLAEALAKGQISAKDVIQLLAERDENKRALNLQLLQKFMESDALGEDVAEKMALQTLYTILKDSAADPSVLASLAAGFTPSRALGEKATGSSGQKEDEASGSAPPAGERKGPHEKIIEHDPAPAFSEEEEEEDQSRATAEVSADPDQNDREEQVATTGNIADPFEPAPFDTGTDEGGEKGG